MSDLYKENFPDGRSALGEEEMMRVMQAITQGGVDHDALKGFLINMNARGEVVDEISGAARFLRENSLRIQAPYAAVDCCGTGGDHSGTYNISTAVAFVAAACGVPMAKHGNRASSSKSGAADVLEVLGVNLDAEEDVLREALHTLNFAFLMAPHHHHSLKHVALARKEIGTRTIFNLLGPLINPAGAKLQLMGVFDRAWVRPIAEVLRNLGARRAWVVHGSDGLDEITVTGETYVAMLDDEDNIDEKTLSPEDFGLERHEISALKGGDAQYNAMALRAVLEGKTGAYRDIVLANTAAVLCIHDRHGDLKTSVEQARNAIDNGSALQVLKDYIALTRQSL